MANGNSAGNSQQSQVLINVGVTGQEQVQQATQDVQQLNNTANQSGKVDMAAPVKTLRQELRQANNDLQRMAALGQQNTQEFAETAARVAQLRNDIDETNNSIRAFDPDNKFKVFANFASAGAKALAGYTGVLNLIGVESEDAAQTIAKLQSLMALSEAIDSLGDIKDSFKDLGRLLSLTTTATQATTAAQNAQAVASTTQAAATEGVVVANNAATASAVTLRGALSAIGIGLLISAVAYLITNWDSLKASVQKLFPVLNETKGGFEKVSQVISGVGSVIINVLKAPIDALITQFKVLYKVMVGDFKGALQEFKNGANQLAKDFDVVGNYQSGVADKLAAQREEHRKAELTKDIENLKKRIEVQKAAGKDATQLQQKLYKEQLELAKGNEEETAKLKQEYAVAQAAEEKRKADEAKAIAKKASDEAKERRKSDLAELKKSYDEAKKIVTDASKSQRDIELNDLDIKYKKEFALLEKRKADIKNYNAEHKTLTQARKIEEAKINKTYDDIIKAYSDEVNDAYLSDFDKREKEINKRADELLKNATPAQKGLIEQNRNFLLTRNTDEANASTASTQAQTNLTTAEDVNRPNKNDTPEQARLKVENLAKAKLDAENAAFELKKVQLSGQKEELEALEAEHEKSINDIKLDGSEARKAIDKAEQEARLANLETVGSALNSVAGAVSESSAAGKVLAIANATIDTYVGATKALAQGGIFGYVGAAGIIATGLANVKRITAVKIPGANNSSTGNASITAPVINSTVISRENNGTNELRKSIDNTTKQPQEIRAYIVDKDLEKQKSKSSYFNSQSTI